MKKTILTLIISLLSFLSFSQVTPSGGISGSGTATKIPKFISSKKIGNSAITDDGTSYYVTYSGKDLFYCDTTETFMGISTLKHIDVINLKAEIKHNIGIVLNSPSVTVNGSTSYSTSAQAITSRENLLVKEVYTTSDATTTSSVAANVSALTFTPTINKMYKVDGAIRIGCNNTGGIKLAISVPTGATFTLSFSGSLTSNDTYRTAVVTSSGSLSNALNTFNGSNYTRVSGFVWMSSTSGTITLSIASTTNGQTSTLYSGSWVTFTQLD